MPKSRIFTIGGRPSRSARKRFSGLRSRWTIPSPCALSSARGELAHPVDHLRGRGLSFHADALEVPPREQLHHQEGRVVELVRDVRVDDAHDVLALHGAVDAGLAAKTLDELRRQQRTRQHQLQREVLAGVRVHDLVDRAHPALRDQPDRSIPPADDGRKLRRLCRPLHRRRPDRIAKRVRSRHHRWCGLPLCPHGPQYMTEETASCTSSVQPDQFLSESR